MSKKTRELRTVTAGHPATDGDGVSLTRIIGTPELKYAGSVFIIRCI